MSSYPALMEILESRRLLSASPDVIADDRTAINTQRIEYARDKRDLKVLLVADAMAIKVATRQRNADVAPLKQELIDDTAAGKSLLASDVATLRSTATADKAAIRAIAQSIHEHRHDPVQLAADLVALANGRAIYITHVTSNKATIRQHTLDLRAELVADKQAIKLFLHTDSADMIAARQKLIDDRAAGIARLADDVQQIRDAKQQLRDDLAAPASDPSSPVPPVGGEPTPPAEPNPPTPEPPSPDPDPDPPALEALHLLFYGASFVNGWQVGKGDVLPVPTLISEIAVAAGFPPPVISKHAADGQTLAYALDHFSNSQVSNETDYVIMQEFSTRSSDIAGEGDPQGFFADALEIYEKVRAIAPEAVPVLYEPWSRSPQNTGDLPKFFPNLTQGGAPYTAAANEFQSEIRKYNEQAARYIDDRTDGITTRIARAGDAFQNSGWDEDLYDKDHYHGSEMGYVLSAMVQFETIYHVDTRNVNLSSVFSNHHISASDGANLVNLAD